MTAEAALLGLFLSRHPRPYAVSLGVLVTEARQATGRDPRTGRRDHSAFHGDVPLYPGTAAYLSAVDWAGVVLRPVDRESAARAPFLRALELFSDLPEEQREALYAFRCAWLHPYQPVGGAARPRSYRFSISTDGSGPLLREQVWDGDMRGLVESTATVVDLESVGTFVEELYARLRGMHERRELALALPGGVAELRDRMAFFWTAP